MRAEQVKIGGMYETRIGGDRRVVRVVRETRVVRYGSAKDDRSSRAFVKDGAP